MTRARSSYLRQASRPGAMSYICDELCEPCILLGLFVWSGHPSDGLIILNFVHGREHGLDNNIGRFKQNEGTKRFLGGYAMHAWTDTDAWLKFTLWQLLSLLLPKPTRKTTVLVFHLQVRWEVVSICSSHLLKRSDESYRIWYIFILLIISLNDDMK